MTESKSRWVVFTIGIALLATSIACGNASGSASPTGPSGTGSGGAVINGRVRGLSTPVTANSFAPLATSSVRVTISGTNISSTVDGTGQFTLTGVPPGDVTMQFSGPGVSASITLKGVTADQQISIDVTLNGTSAHLDSESRHKDGGHDIEGKITAVNGNTITVGGSVITVPSTAKIHRGATAMTFADLKVGVEVEVETTMNGTTLTATDVSLEDGNDDGDDDHDGLSDVSGAVSGLTGTCPALTFTVQTITVKTSPSTTFDGGCSQIKNTVRVEAKGTLSTDGKTLTASRVGLDN